MKEVRSIVISGYGTNCEMEMARACRLVGGSEVVDIVHINELINGERRFTADGDDAPPRSLPSSNQSSSVDSGGIA